MTPLESRSAGDGSNLPRLTFRRRHRLSRSLDYQAVYKARKRCQRGPLTIFGRPNQLPHCRLGLSVGRRVGGAVVRNRIKRLLREAFRLSMPELPPGYDFVINVSPHEALSLDDYQRLLMTCCQTLHREWSRSRHSGDSPSRDTPR